VTVISINGSQAPPPLNKISYYFGGYFQRIKTDPTVFGEPHIAVNSFYS